MKKEQPQQKSSTSGKKIKLTKSNNVEQKNPTQKNMSEATCLKDEVRGRHEKEMYYFFQVLFNVFF
jgi:hypothetical protein